MALDITCADCGAKRSNARYKNTRYCTSCRLLRDLQFLGDAGRACGECGTWFTPIGTKDRLCGDCNYGSSYRGDCLFCATSDAELHRSDIPVCVRCVRDPAQRTRLIAGLRKGQRDRKATHA